MGLMQAAQTSRKRRITAECQPTPRVSHRST